MTRAALPFLVVLVTVLAMEAIASLVHRYVMHGFGWRWHRSHHAKHRRGFEMNDLYALVFAALSLALFALGRSLPSLWWAGVGMVIYGTFYALLHDGLVHRRLPLPHFKLRGYLRRLVQAHRVHHAVRERDGAVSFGFLYAPPARRLVDQLRRRP